MSARVDLRSDEGDSFYLLETDLGWLDDTGREWVRDVGAGRWRRADAFSRQRATEVAGAEGMAAMANDDAAGQSEIGKLWAKVREARAAWVANPNDETHRAHSDAKEAVGKALRAQREAAGKAA